MPPTLPPPHPAALPTPVPLAHPRLLVIQTAFIGDAILGLAVPQALKRLYPDAQVHYLVRRGNESIAAGHPDIHQTWVWDKKDGKYRSLWQLLRQIRATQFGAVVTLQRFAATGLLCGLSGAGIRVGFQKNPLAWRFTHAYPHVLGTVGASHCPHESDRNLSLLAAFGIANPPPEWRRPQMYPPSEAIAKVLPMLPTEAFVALAPASVWFTKQWPVAHWQELARLLGHTHRVVVLGGPGDVALCQTVADAVPGGGVNLAGKLSLIESAVAIGHAARVFANDSAPLHLASAMGTPSTALYISTVPEFGFGPLAPGSTVAQSPGQLACRPCGLHGHSACPQGHFRCGIELTPERVLAASAGLLGEVFDSSCT